MEHTLTISRYTHFFLADKRSAILWLLVRLYVGWEWFSAGWGKVTNPMWVGTDAGNALFGFIQGALPKMAGAHPDVSQWYGWFLMHVVGEHLTIWSNFVAFGELFVGLGLLFGCLTGVAAFFGVMMNVNYLLSGAVSINPQLLLLGIFLILARRVAGEIGLDHFVRPYCQARYEKMAKLAPKSDQV